MMEALAVVVATKGWDLEVFGEWIDEGYHILFLDIASDPGIYPVPGAPRDIEAEVSRCMSSANLTLNFYATAIHAPYPCDAPTLRTVSRAEAYKQ